MRVVNICLNDFNSICEFQKIIESSPASFDMQQGHTMIDGKSIIGIMSLDLSSPVKLNINGTSEEEETVLSNISKYIIG